jgi:DNA-binding CsgD family transcriptional regulator
MHDHGRGIVLFGDVIESRREPERSSAWLRSLRTALEREIPTADRLAPFGVTQGDELQGLLAADADPFRAILVGSLEPAAQPMRWVVSAGPIDPGRGPAIERTGPAFLSAREAVAVARARRDLLLVTTGEPGADRLLAELAPVLGEMLADLTDRQRVVARLMLVDDLRQADVADRLGVARATVSVAHARGHIRSIGRLVTALRAIFRAATLALADEDAAVGGRAGAAAAAAGGPGGRSPAVAAGSVR